METEWQAAIFCNRAELESDNSEALLNVATCRALLHDYEAKCHRSLPNTIDSVVRFDTCIAVAEPGQSEDVGSNQVSEDRSETGDSGDQ